MKNSKEDLETMNNHDESSCMEIVKEGSEEGEVSFFHVLEFSCDFRFHTFYFIFFTKF